ncbi:germ cell nuclear acidic protein isoform X2 [Gouania willdenowi]|uniref:germ cell nuclear acidic protein isoform X2 n=1 Tax=Gouania willdenowi TaxID=441366 RepID=UPI0010544EAA|nr:acidic repeat-containing protein-like isoform X2 [Gouania willdenowi]
MNDDTCSLFKKLADKIGWTENGGLDATEKKLISAIGKSRHAATSGQQSACESSDDDDDDFDQFLQEQSTPQAKTSSLKSFTSAKKNSSKVIDVSSDDDSDTTFETFLQQVKTPNPKYKTISSSGSDDSIKNFIDDDYSSGDDFIKPKSFKVPKKICTPVTTQTIRKPVFEFNSPVFVSASEDEGDIVVKSTWRSRHSKPHFPLKTNDKRSAVFTSSKRTLSAPSKLDTSDSSEEEFSSLLERLKKKNIISASPVSFSNPKVSGELPAMSAPSVKPRTPAPKPSSFKTLPSGTPINPSVLKPIRSQTEPRAAPTNRAVLCRTPGCFLQSLSNPGSSYVDGFKRLKEELTHKLYKLYNTSVFDSKLPSDMSVTWNKKMRKTAGYCITGQEKGGGSRYARIELSEKVCDSADRLRDTLIHEMCHAATWLLNSVRDGHGNFWKLYARKATMVHPELPVVTRCHSYDIKYKFQYQCTRCKNTIGRHSKSLDTQRFVCALCTGQLVLLAASKPRAPTPFANFVKENYGNVRQQLVNHSHAEVMRKLSADFATKTKLSES